MFSSAFALLVVIALISTAVDSGKHTRNTSSRRPSTGSTHPAAPAAAPGLSAGQQQFVSGMRSSSVFSTGSGTTAAQIAAFGQQVCTDRQDGQAQRSVIRNARGTWTHASAMEADQMVRLAEKDICASYLPPETVTYIVRGTPGAQVTYGPAGSDDNGNVPMRVTAPLGDPEYYAISAQLQGSGTVTCVIKVDGISLSTSTAAGGYNIADCQIGQDPVTDLWKNDNSG